MGYGAEKAFFDDFQTFWPFAAFARLAPHFARNEKTQKRYENETNSVR